MKKIKGQWRSLRGFVFCVFLLSGCAQTSETYPSFEESSLYRFLNSPEIQDSSLISDHEKKGLQYLYEEELERASLEFNQAANKNPEASMPHFLNGLTYHLMGKRGETKKLDLAEIGYDLAIKKDKTHSFSYYFRGILKLEKKLYKSAQEDFAAAIIQKPENARMLHGLAISSYYVGDMQIAAGAIHRALALEPENTKYLHTASMIMAAGGEFSKAKKIQEKLSNSENALRKASFLKTRISDWQSFHSKYLRLAAGENLSTGGFGALQENPGISEQQNNSEATNKKEDVDPRMVIVDVVLILTEENHTDVYGLHLLENLKVNFGNGTDPFMAFRSGHGFNTDFGNDSTSGYAAGAPKFKNYQYFLQRITIPAVTYNINMASSNGSRSEILARPTLLARHGQSSQFFSGDDITFGFGTNNNIDFKEKQVGVFLIVTPYIMSDGRVNIKLDVKRSFFVPLSAEIQSTSGFQTSTTRLISDVVLEAGDTLVLGGLSDRVHTNEKDGTSILGDIPVLDFFFSKKVESQRYKSVIILVTPRLPQYTYRTTRSIERQAKRQKTSLELAAIDEVRGRYSDWFKVYSNLGAIFDKLQGNELYRELRTGDVTLEKWESKYNILPQVQESLNSIY